MKITELLNIKYPIIQGGMARIARGKLAASVSNAGGLGLVGTGGFPFEEFKKEVAIARELTEPGKVFGVNLVLIEPDIEEKIQYTIDQKIPVVTLAAGNPAPYINRLKDAGIKVLCVIGNSKMAIKCESLGADGVILEGLEAGGHLSKTTTMGSLLITARSVSIPVIAAGGIGDGAQILACEIMGASGIQMGTRFLASDETPVHDNFKDHVVAAKEYETAVIGSAYGHTTRQLRNEMTDAAVKAEAEGASLEEFETIVRGTLSKAVFDGDVTHGSMMAGISVGLVEKRQSVKEIFEELIQEYKEAKKKIIQTDDFL
ncbi:nitronate monooxygenase [Guggenheimella bovis]